MENRGSPSPIRNVKPSDIVTVNGVRIDFFAQARRSRRSKLSQVAVVILTQPEVSAGPLAPRPRCHGGSVDLHADQLVVGRPGLFVFFYAGNDYDHRRRCGKRRGTGTRTAADQFIGRLRPASESRRRPARRGAGLRLGRIAAPAVAGISA
jgi:hypothetical protein